MFFPHLWVVFDLCREVKCPEDFWMTMVEKLSKEELGQAAIVLWVLWNYRNNCNTNHQTPDLGQIRRSIENGFNDLAKAGKNYLVAALAKSQMSHNWTPLGSGWWKFNSDVSWIEASRK